MTGDLANIAPVRSLPDGQIGCSPVQPFSQKYICSRFTQITFTTAPSRPTEGRLAIVTNAGRDAVDAKTALTNGANADGEVVWS